LILAASLALAAPSLAAAEQPPGPAASSGPTTPKPAQTAQSQPAASLADAHSQTAAAGTPPAESATTQAGTTQAGTAEAGTAEAVRIALILTVLSLIPALIICMTPFVRIIVVLSMIRHAFGMPDTPPNQVLTILALFLTAFVMMPTLTKVNESALKPYLGGSLSVEQALGQGAGPMRQFMLRQVHDSDLATVYQIARQPLPGKAADVGLMQLTSAFMLNELRVSFKIGFVIMLPFLLIDLVVSSILLSLGMIMVPPTTLSLPIKILMFVLIDGWSLVLQGVVGSFR
jgi:flagellar biosynthetic protein FliP